MEITLQDVNDNPPVFPTDMLDLTVEENIGDGSKIMQLTATDADEVGSGYFSEWCYSVGVKVIWIPRLIFYNITETLRVVREVNIKWDYLLIKNEVWCNLSQIC